MQKISEVYELAIKKELENGTRWIDIEKTYNVTSWSIHLIAKKYNLQKRKVELDYITSMFNLKDRKVFINKSGKKQYRYIVPCSKCLEYNSILRPKINELVKRKLPYLCKKCNDIKMNIKTYKINCVICKKNAIVNSSTQVTCGSSECFKLNRKKLNKKYHNRHKNEEQYLTKKFKNTYETMRCKECGSTINIKKTILNQKNCHYTCFDCYNKSNFKSKDMASKKKMKNNPSGYIGIGTHISHDKIFGVKAILIHKGLLVLQNRYKDPDLHEKTFIQGAVDRDLFIIEKKLPHTRNFTDKELLANMQYLGIHVENIEQILKENR